VSGSRARCRHDAGGLCHGETSIPGDDRNWTLAERRSENEGIGCSLYRGGKLPRSEVMQTPDEVAAMLRLKELGGTKRIARELGCSHMTILHYIGQGGWAPYRGRADAARWPGLRIG
jgi:hypothetical protein